MAIRDSLNSAVVSAQDAAMSNITTGDLITQAIGSLQRALQELDDEESTESSTQSSGSSMSESSSLSSESCSSSHSFQSAFSSMQESVLPIPAPIGNAQWPSLPYAWNWCRGNNANGPGPQWQADQINAGRHLIPHLDFGVLNGTAGFANWLAPALDAAKQNNLPFALIFGHNLMDWWRLKNFAASINPDDHPFWIRKLADGTLNADKLLSPWSYRTDFAYDLGRLFGQHVVTQEIADQYPDPPYVLCCENNEAGYLKKIGDILADVRCPAWITNLVTLRDSMADGQEKEAVAGLVATIIGQAILSGFWSHYGAFARGWAETNPWGDKARWIAYAQTGNEYGSAGTGTPNIASGQYGFDMKEIIGGYGGEEKAIKHRWGATGSCYNNSWYGGFDTVRTIIQADNIRFGMDWREMIGLDWPRMQLTWEGSADIPTRQQWAGLVRYWLWVTHSTFLGQFANSQTQITAPAIADYYDELIEAVDEVWYDSRLQSYWLDGTPIPSSDPSPYPRVHPAMEHANRSFLLAVDANNRYDAQGDVWTRDRTHQTKVPVVAAAWQRTDGKRLLYVAGVRQDVPSVTVTIPGYGTWQGSALIGGEFHEL